MAHPIHPMFVHFPIACWSIATIADVVNLIFGVQTWWLSGVLLTIGIITALVAMLAGLIDLAKIDEKSPAFKIVNWHIFFVVISWVSYTASLSMRVKSNHIIEPNIVAVLFSIMGFLILSIVGWLGGKLVYEYGVGTSKQKD